LQSISYIPTLDDIVKRNYIFGFLWYTPLRNKTLYDVCVQVAEHYKAYTLHDFCDIRGEFKYWNYFQIKIPTDISDLKNNYLFAPKIYTSKLTDVNGIRDNALKSPVYDTTNIETINISSDSDTEDIFNSEKRKRNSEGKNKEAKKQKNGKQKWK